MQELASPEPDSLLLAGAPIAITAIGRWAIVRRRDDGPRIGR